MAAIHAWLLAYIDPSTGAIVLQVIAAGLLTAGVIFRGIFFHPIRTLQSLFSRKRYDGPEATVSDDDT